MRTEKTWWIKMNVTQNLMNYKKMSCKIWSITKYITQNLMNLQSNVKQDLLNFKGCEAKLDELSKNLTQILVFSPRYKEITSAASLFMYTSHVTLNKWKNMHCHFKCFEIIFSAVHRHVSKCANTHRGREKERERVREIENISQPGGSIWTILLILTTESILK